MCNIFWGRPKAAPILFPIYLWNYSMIQFWNFLFDGWITNVSPKSKYETVKIPIKDGDKKENVSLRLVPDKWEKLPTQKIISLARDLTGEKYKSKAAAVKAIKKVIQGKN